ncbi:MAG: hypothetical protein JW954_06500 [Dehalococcoidaceae bacterium]|nr:hypothetical protein [Dehalococcoidaceae bacterium]
MENRYIKLTYKFSNENDQVLARCVELGTAVFADTEEEAHRKLAEAVECHLNTLHDVGEDERFFREHGIQVHTGTISENKPGRTTPRTTEIKTEMVLQPC